MESIAVGRKDLGLEWFCCSLIEEMLLRDCDG